MYAAQGGSLALPTLKWLLEEGGARITDRDHKGYTALLLTTLGGSFATCQWLLEDGGADIAEANDAGQTVWDSLESVCSFHPDDEEVAEVTALLRVMVLKGDPPADFLAYGHAGIPEYARLVEEGARLRAALPAYLVRRRALLDDHCPLIAPLLALVRDYNPEPTTTEELWATGLGAAPQLARRPRLEAAVALPMRRSARLRQRLE
jgi:hypothetical protein